MIVVKEFPNNKFESKEELFKALKENKAELIATKKMQTKQADAVFNVVPLLNDKGEAVKAESIDTSNVNQIKAE